MKFARIRQRIGENRFLRNVLILAGGTAFAQALAAICLPLLTRIYTPADFELLAVYVSIITLVTVVSCLRYNLAIPIPDQDDKAISLLALSVIASIGFTVIISVCVFVFPNYFLLLLGRLDLAPYLWMVPVGVLLASLYNALQYWASRRRHFAIITRTRMGRAVGGVGSQLGIGALSSGPFGLIFGHMLYGGLGVLRLATSLWASDRACLSTLTLSGMRVTAFEYRKFPLLSVPEAFFNTAGSQLPLLIVAATTLSAEAGYLMLAMRVMGLPMGLIGSSVGQVYLTEAPARLRAGGLKVLTHKTMIVLAKTGGIPLFAVGCVSPYVFGYIFGREWEFAGLVVAWLMPSFVLQFVASPVSVLLHVTGQVKEAMWLQMFGCVLRVGAVWVAAAFWPNFQIEFYAVSSALFYLAYIVIVMRVARRADFYAGAG